MRETGLRIIEEAEYIQGQFQPERAVQISQLIFPVFSLLLTHHFNRLKPFNSTLFSTLIMCNHHHHIISEHFHCPKKETPYSLHSGSPFSPLLSPRQH